MVAMLMDECKLTMLVLFSGEVSQVVHVSFFPLGRKETAPS